MSRTINSVAYCKLKYICQVYLCTEMKKHIKSKNSYFINFYDGIGTKKFFANFFPIPSIFAKMNVWKNRILNLKTFKKIYAKQQ